MAVKKFGGYITPESANRVHLNLLEALKQGRRFWTQGIRCCSLPVPMYLNLLFLWCPADGLVKLSLEAEEGQFSMGQYGPLFQLSQTRLNECYVKVAPL